MSRRLRQGIETLDRLAREVEQWSTVDAEGLSDREAFARVVPEAIALTTRSFELFDALLSGGGTKHSSIELLVASGDDYGERLDRAADSRSSSAIADVAFLAKMELAQQQAHLERLEPGQSKWLVLEAAERLRRRQLNAFTALGRAIRRRLGEQAVDLRFISELSRSLLTRKVLATFWHRIAATASSPLLQRLRLAGTAIAMLQGNDGYRDLRLGDRRMLHELQARILEWLRSERAPHDGSRIAQDLEGVVSLTRQINRRAELVEHDRFVCLRIAERARATATTDTAGRELLVRELSCLIGRDPTLDRLIAADEPPHPADLVRTLEAVRAEGSDLPVDLRPSTEELRRAAELCLQS